MQRYASEEEVLQDAFRSLLRTRPSLRIQGTIHRYQIQRFGFVVLERNKK